jgi:hypothetical protein
MLAHIYNMNSFIFNSPAYLFRAAPYNLIFVLHKDALFHCLQPKDMKNTLKKVHSTTHSRGRLSTVDLLNNVACFTKSK